MDKGKPTLDLLLATKAVVERDIDLGLIKPERLKFVFADAIARRKAFKEASEEGLSQREIAKIAGVDQSTVSRAMRNANASKSDANASAKNGKSGEPRTTRELLGQSDQNDWRTPRKFLDAARSVMGAIDLDPATSAEANETVQASMYYTELDNGLEKPWKGRIWLNPPYGGEARLFIERLIREYEVGNVTAACTLINSHPTETKWFQQLFDYAICFIRGRIDFGGPSREVSSTSTHGSAIAYLGADVDAFSKVFSEFGSVVRKVRS